METDFDETTIATARPVQAESRIKPDDLTDLPTYPLQMPETPDASTQDIDLTDEILTVPLPKETIKPVFEPETTPQPALKKIEIERDVKSYNVEDTNGFGKILSSLLLLLLGGLIGAGAVYLFSQNKQQPEVPQIVQQQTANIPYSAFEDNRRNVDRNPEQYIFTTNGKAESSEEYYLLGRANLLTGKYSEAKKAFEEAKNRLSQTNEVNSKILANEIAMALAIINDPFAQKAFEKDMILNNSGANVQSNSANGFSNANQSTNSFSNRSF